MKRLLSILLIFCLGLCLHLQAQSVENYPIEGTFWRALPHEDVVLIGGRYMIFSDTEAGQILFAPKSHIKHYLWKQPYTQTDKGIFVNDCVGKFHSQDSLYLYKAPNDSLVDVFVRTTPEEILQLDENTEDFQNIMFNSSMSRIHMEAGTRYVFVYEAGNLRYELSQIPSESLKSVKKLTIGGPMNGDDIAAVSFLLRRETQYPNIKTLDLSKAWIITDTITWNSFEVNYTHKEFLEEKGIRRTEPAHLYDYQAYADSLHSVQDEYSYLYEVVPDSLYFRKDASVYGHIMRYSLGQLYNVEHILLPINTQYIDYAAFYECTQLEEITLPKSVKHVRPLAFTGCKNLKKVHVAEDSPLLKDKKFLPNSQDADNPFLLCHPDLKIETYPSVPPMATLRIHGKTHQKKLRLFDQYRVQFLDDINPQNGEFDAEITAPRNALIDANNYGDLYFIAEPDADLQIDGNRVHGGPLNDAFDAYCQKINKIARKIHGIEYRLSHEWKADSIRVLKQRKNTYQTAITTLIVDACVQYPFSPIAPYLLVRYRTVLTSNMIMDMLAAMSYENAVNPAIRNEWRCMHERTEVDGIDWYQWADTAQMTKIRVPSAGSLHTCLENIHPDSLKNRLYIGGSVNRADLVWLKDFVQKQHIKALDLSAAEILHIPDSVFCFNSSLRYICLPKRASTIGKMAFFDCNGLRHIVLPKWLNKIGEKAFAHCTSLYHINLPASLRIIENSAFHYCINLKEVNLPDKLQTLGIRAFSHCPNLRRISIPSATTEIGFDVLMNSPEAEVIIDEGNTHFISIENQIVGRTEADRQRLRQQKN